MEELEKVLDSDEEVLWSRTEPLLRYYPDKKSQRAEIILYLIMLPIFIIGMVLGFVFDLIPGSYTYIYYLLLIGAYVVVYPIAWILEVDINKARYEKLRETYSEEQIRGLGHKDALTNKSYIQRMPHGEKISLTPEHIELLKPFSKIGDNYIKIDLTKLRLIKIDYSFGLCAKLNFTQDIEIDEEKVSIMRKMQLDSYFDILERKLEFHVILKKNGTMKEFLSVIKGKLHGKTGQTLVQFESVVRVLPLVGILVGIGILLIPLSF